MSNGCIVYSAFHGLHILFRCILILFLRSLLTVPWNTMYNKAILVFSLYVGVDQKLRRRGRASLTSSQRISRPNHVWNGGEDQQNKSWTATAQRGTKEENGRRSQVRNYSLLNALLLIWWSVATMLYVPYGTTKINFSQSCCEMSLSGALRLSLRKKESARNWDLRTERRSELPNGWRQHRKQTLLSNWQWLRGEWRKTKRRSVKRSTQGWWGEH